MSVTAANGATLTVVAHSARVDGEIYEVSIRMRANDGSTVTGDVTMCHATDGRATGYAAAGQSPDAWVSPGIIYMVERQFGDDAEATRDMLDELEALASVCITRSLGGGA